MLYVCCPTQVIQPLQKSPMYPQKSPTYPHKCSTYVDNYFLPQQSPKCPPKSPTQVIQPLQKSPMYPQKSPLYPQKSCIQVLRFVRTNPRCAKKKNMHKKCAQKCSTYPKMYRSHNVRICSTLRMLSSPLKTGF